MQSCRIGLTLHKNRMQHCPTACSGAECEAERLDRILKYYSLDQVPQLFLQQAHRAGEIKSLLVQSCQKAQSPKVLSIFTGIMLSHAKSASSADFCRPPLQALYSLRYRPLKLDTIGFKKIAKNSQQFTPTFLWVKNVCTHDQGNFIQYFFENV